MPPLGKSTRAAQRQPQTPTKTKKMDPKLAKQPPGGAGKRSTPASSRAASGATTNTLKSKPSLTPQKATMGKQSQKATAGKQSQKATAGKQSQKATMGKQSQKAIVGKQSQKAIVGKQSQKAIVGKQSQKATMGKQSQKTTAGKQSQKATMGKQSQKAIVGKQSQKAIVGKQSQKAIVGKQSQKAIVGKQLQKGKPATAEGLKVKKSVVLKGLGKGRDDTHKGKKQAGVKSPKAKPSSPAGMPPKGKGAIPGKTAVRGKTATSRVSPQGKAASPVKAAPSQGKASVPRGKSSSQTPKGTADPQKLQQKKVAARQPQVAALGKGLKTQKMGKTSAAKQTLDSKSKAAILKKSSVEGKTKHIGKRDMGKNPVEGKVTKPGSAKSATKSAPKMVAAAAPVEKKKVSPNSPKSAAKSQMGKTPHTEKSKLGVKPSKAAPKKPDSWWLTSMVRGLMKKIFGGTQGKQLQQTVKSVSTSHADGFDWCGVLSAQVECCNIRVSNPLANRLYQNNTFPRSSSKTSDVVPSSACSSSCGLLIRNCISRSVCWHVFAAAEFVFPVV